MESSPARVVHLMKENKKSEIIIIINRVLQPPSTQGALRGNARAEKDTDIIQVMSRSAKIEKNVQMMMVSNACFVRRWLIILTRLDLLITSTAAIKTINPNNCAKTNNYLSKPHPPREDGTRPTAPFQFALKQQDTHTQLNPPHRLRTAPIGGKSRS